VANEDGAKDRWFKAGVASDDVAKVGLYTVDGDVTEGGWFGDSGDRGSRTWFKVGGSRMKVAGGG
jgi:hypothetical protein